MNAVWTWAMAMDGYGYMDSMDMGYVGVEGDRAVSSL